MSGDTTARVGAGIAFLAASRKLVMCAGLLGLVVGLSAVSRAQQIEETHRAGPFQGRLLSKPLGIAGEVGAAARDFAAFRDPQWSVLTLAQIGAASADAVTSLNNLHGCSGCIETGPSRIFVGVRPDAHKYVTAGIFEIGIEAVTAHYFRNHGAIRKWYWRTLWTLPQSLSLYEHTRASRHNAALNLAGLSTSSSHQQTSSTEK